ncbi:MAG: hypothetical protein ACK5Q6_00500 [Cyanobacteriota bacterium]|jgi:hypothetical protein
MHQTEPVDEQPLWPWKKAPARPSLVRLGQAATARGWILNLVQLGHWLVLLSVLPVAWVAFSRADGLAAQLGSSWQVFALLISIVLPVAASAGPIMMHAREQWQLTPPAGAYGIQDGHDPVLRRLAYRTLFSGLTLAQLLLPLAVFGLQPALVALVLALGLVVVAGPSRPLVPWRHAGVHLMPVAQPLALAMGASIVLSVAAYWKLLAPGLVAMGWPAAAALLPLVCNGVGGALEATQAETTYNQWWHLVAVVVLSGGSLLYGFLLALVS